MRKNPEDRNQEKIVLFVTKEQKEKLLDHVAHAHTTMSEWVRDKIDRLPK